MRSFLAFFYILDQGYDQCKENDLGRFLGAISPELWGDGQPADRAIYNDWQNANNFQTIDENNIMKKTYDFLEDYERKFGFDFCKIKKWLIMSNSQEIVRRAFDKADMMCQKFEYDI